jgi:putative tryptophan/tyrosine transport system substrate-binding protein
MPVIGFLSPRSADDSNSNRQMIGFFDALKEAGYVEGQNFAMEYRWAEDRPDRFPALAADLVRRRVSVITAIGTAAALAAKAATPTIPIVFGTVADPVATGLVASLNRPGGNVTGSTSLTTELGPKRLQVLRELIPDAALFGVLANPGFPDTPSLRAALRTAELYSGAWKHPTSWGCG